MVAGSRAEALSVVPAPAAGPSRVQARLTFVVALLLAFPYETLSIEGLLVAVAWGLLCAFGMAFIVRHRLVLGGTFAICFGLAYSPGLGTVFTEGVERMGMHASADATRFGFLLFLVFIGGTLLVAWRVRERLGRRRVRPARPPILRGADLALAIVFTLTLLTAVQTGFWTYWGGTGRVEAAAGGIRLELLYSPLVFAVIAHLASRPLAVGGPRRPWPRWLPRAALLGLLVVLVFLLQSRRMMLASASVILLVWLTREQLTTSRRPTGRALRVAALVAAVAVMLTASAGWRDVVGGETAGVGDRLQRASSAVGDTEGFTALEGRLTYLWIDSQTPEIRQGFHGGLDLVDLTLSKLAAATPRLLLPTKEDVEPVSCESAFVMVGLTNDLPCTPVTEGWLVGEWLGLLLAILLWGIPIGLAEHLAARRGGLAPVMGFLLFANFTQIETVLLAVVDGLRSMAILLVLCGGVMVVWSLLVAAHTAGYARSGPSGPAK